MRLLILVFLFGITFSKPVHDAVEFEVDDILADTKFVLSSKASSVLSTEGDEPDTEIVKKYKEAIDAIAEKIEDAIANRKPIKNGLLKEFIALRQEIVDKKGELGEKAVELLQKIREHIKDLLIKLVISLGKKEQKRSEPENEVLKKYKEDIEAIVEKIEDAIANGKKLKKAVLQKFIALKQEIVDKKDELGEKADELLQKIREHVKDLMIKLVISLKKKEEEKQFAEENKMKEALEGVLEKIMDDIDKGKSVKAILIEKLRELIQKFKELKMDWSERAKELLEKIKEHGKDFIRKLLEKLRLMSKTGQNDAELLEYLKQNPELRAAVETLQELLTGHVPDIKEVVAEVEAILRCQKEH